MGVKQRKRLVAKPSADGEDGAPRRRETEVEKKAREETEADELEKQCEDACEKYCKHACLIWMLLAPLISLCAFVTEFATRPPMLPELDGGVDLRGQAAVVTGGCGAIGSELAAMLAACGADVALGCRDAAAAPDAVARISAKAAEISRGSETLAAWAGHAADGVGAVVAFPLDLASLASVRRFAKRFDPAAAGGAGGGGGGGGGGSPFGGERGVQLLVNAAGSAGEGACTWTEDGFERLFQVNFLGHALLAREMLPALRARASALVPSRVIGVGCEAAGEGALDTADLGGTAALTEASVAAAAEAAAGGDDAAAAAAEAALGEGEGGAAAAAMPVGLEAGAAVGGRCSPLRQYADAKLAVVAFGAELERRLRAVPGEDDAVVSHVVDPGATRGAFADAVPVAGGGGPTNLRARLMGYLPPVWLLQKLFGFLKARVMGHVRRDPAVGAAALFHVATSPDLAHPAVGKEFGGGLFADTAGTPFAHCGKHPALCGRAGHYRFPYSLWSGSVVREPAKAARGRVQGRQLWAQTRKLLGGDADAADAVAADAADAEAADAALDDGTGLPVLGMPPPPRPKPPPAAAASPSGHDSMMPPADAFEEEDEFSGV